MNILVPRVADFDITGLGTAKAWNKAEWHHLSRVGTGKSTYTTYTKVLYSKTGIYCLTKAEDKVLTCTYTKDFDRLFLEDVIEMFLWPSTDHPVYFEYEISPLDKELPLLISNNRGKFYGWLPFAFEGDRKTRKATSIINGKKKSGARVDGWTSEFFIPYTLFRGLDNIPPKSGTIWHGNIYRIDYDDAPLTQWALFPEVGKHFHNYSEFGVFEFE